MQHYFSEGADPSASVDSSVSRGMPIIGEGAPQFAESAVDAAEQMRILELLREVGQDLASILNPDQLLLAAGARVRSIVKYDMFSVMFLNERTQRLEHALSVRYDERIHLRTTLGMGEGLCGTAAAERRAIRVNAVDMDPRYVRCELGMAIKSELVVPLIAKDRLIGVLDLESLEADAFSDAHEMMLVTLAATLAVAIENARLYDELKRAEQRMARDLERAREVQLALLPSEKPDIPGIEIATRYEPALEVGGDFYDFLPYGDGRLAIAVGDVAGKGAAAALLATLGIGLLREHAAHHPCAPEEMLAEINRHLQMTGTNGQFVTLALAVYDAPEQTLCIANAGFPPPVLVRDGIATPLQVRGVPLGLFPGTAYEHLRVELRGGDVVAFCSDGIHEQTNNREEEFGVARLLSQLARTKSWHSAERIAGDILTAAMRHAGELEECDECKDDRTVVVLRLKN